MRVGLLDFEPLRITGLREIFAGHPDFQVVATDWAVALKESAFDLVVLVLREQAFSLALLARLRSRQPGLKVLAIGSGSEPEKILEAITAGAKGWLEDTASPAQVMQAAYAILGGSIWAPRQVLATFRRSRPRHLGSTAPAAQPAVYGTRRRGVAAAGARALQSRDRPGAEHPRADGEVLRGEADAESGSGEPHRALGAGRQRGLGRERRVVCPV